MNGKNACKLHNAQKYCESVTDFQLYVCYHDHIHISRQEDYTKNHGGKNCP